MLLNEMDLKMMDSDILDHNAAFKVSNILEFEESNLCNVCTKLLNIAPIYCLETDDQNTVSVCGRCLHVSRQHRGKKWRQIAYENAAKFLTFPCSFKNEGCDLILPWDKVLNHEMGCSSASVICPANESGTYTGINCSWKGNIADIEKHIKIVHEHLILDPPFLKEIPKTSKIFFTHVNAKLATIIMLKQSDEKYHCCALLNGSDVESQCYRYQIELKDESKENSIILRKNRLEPFGNLLANLANKEKLLEINLDAIISMVVLNKDTGGKISARFGVVMKSKKEILQIAEANDVKLSKPLSVAPKIVLNLAPDDNMLSELECPVCNEFMIPPIYLCNNGHSVCHVCLKKLQCCPNCRCSLLGRTRNFTLEKLTTKVHYPCKNREIGCGLVSTSDKIRDHEKFCDLTDTTCPLNCGEKLKKISLRNHINAVHSENIFKLNVINMRDVHDRKENNYAVYAFGEIFRLTLKGGINVPFRFNLQHMRIENDLPRYCYKLELLDQSELELNISVVSIVQPLCENPIRKNPLVIPWELLKPVLTESKKFYYKINMSIAKRT